MLVQVAWVRHPWWRMEANLAIVFTYFIYSQHHLANVSGGENNQIDWDANKKEITEEVEQTIDTLYYSKNRQLSNICEEIYQVSLFSLTLS